ncbi:MAG: hypothetical protein WCB11_20775 [Terriglobales bacterium]
MSPAPKNIAGIISASANSLPAPRLLVGGTSAAWGPVVATVRVAVPVPFSTVIVPNEQVAAGFTTGETLQLSVRLDGFIPPTGLMVIVDFADAPGAIEDGDSVEDVRLKLGAVTIRLKTVEVLPLKFPSPPYAAVMLWGPAASVEIENVAIPLPFTGDVPSCVVPSRKLTVPVGVPAIPGVTVAVKVTFWLRFAEGGFALKAVVVFAFCTTWFKTGDVLGLLFASPL